MRVLHVSRFFHPHVGGTENFIADLSRHLGEAGHECQVLVTDRRRAGIAPAPDVPVEYVRTIGPDSFPKPFGDLRTILNGFAWADVIHVHDVRFLLESATLFHVWRKTPVVLSTHGLMFHTDRRRILKKALWRAYYPRLLSLLSAIICDSRQDLSHCVRAGLASNAVLVPNPVDTTRFTGIPSREPTPGSLLYFGRLDENKGVDLLSRLVRGDASLSLTVVGTGDARYVAKLERLCGDVNGRVRFAGFLGDSEMRAEIAAHECIVVPSRAEGFGLTFVEALATGRPVVASDIPTFREIRGPSGLPFLANFDHPVHARDVIRRAVKEWDAARATARARDFDWGTGVARYVDVYRGCIG